MGSGGVAVRTNDNAALPPPPQFMRQPTPGMCPHDESVNEIRIKSASAEYLLFMDLPRFDWKRPASGLGDPARQFPPPETVTRWDANG